MKETALTLWNQLIEWASEPTHATVLGGAALLYTLAWWAIFARAGFTGALGLLMLVPGVNVVLFLLIAFWNWPASRELRSLRKLETAVNRAGERYSSRAA